MIPTPMGAMLMFKLCFGVESVLRERVGFTKDCNKVLDIISQGLLYDPMESVARTKITKQDLGAVVAMSNASDVRERLGCFMLFYPKENARSVKLQGAAKILGRLRYSAVLQLTLGIPAYFEALQTSFLPRACSQSMTSRCTYKRQ